MALFVPASARIAGAFYATKEWLAFFQQLGIRAGTSPGVLSNPTLLRPPIVSEGDFWVEASGVSPARTIDLVVRDGGADRILATLTY